MIVAGDTVLCGTSGTERDLVLIEVAGALARRTREVVEGAPRVVLQDVTSVPRSRWSTPWTTTTAVTSRPSAPPGSTACSIAAWR